MDGVDPRIKDVLLFVSTNLHKKITLTEVCRIANLSPSRFCELFKRETGHTLSKFISEERIKKACRLLKKNSISIKQITFEVGYHFESNFGHDFKRIIGISPLEYRKHQQSFKVRFHVQKMLGHIYRLIVRFANIFVRFANKK